MIRRTPTEAYHWHITAAHDLEREVRNHGHLFTARNNRRVLRAAARHRRKAAAAAQRLARVRKAHR